MRTVSARGRRSGEKVLDTGELRLAHEVLLADGDTVLPTGMTAYSRSNKPDFYAPSYLRSW